jgi:hypothetical protein
MFVSPTIIMLVSLDLYLSIYQASGNIWDYNSFDNLKYFLIKNILKYFFYFLKIIFDINSSKRSKNIIYFILNKKNQILKEHNLHRIPK